MEFEWDGHKATMNFTKHGISFDEALLVFFDPGRRTWSVDRSDYGETRWMTIGIVRGQAWSVVHTQRGDATRIISARKASVRERKLYAEGESRRRSE